ncbi:MAG: hypothetical protein HC908_02080, partial [Calothrix sp. SM1_7_51]|nr:hypothetical protein [Calothrix sp. SM1_7_51]
MSKNIPTNAKETEGCNNIFLLVSVKTVTMLVLYSNEKVIKIMKNKKSILNLVGILIALLCVTGCGENNTNSVSQSQTATTTTSNGEVTVSTSSSSTSENTDKTSSETQVSPI